MRNGTAFLAWAVPAALLFTVVARETGPGPGLRFEKVRSGPHVTDVGASPSASWIDFDEDGDEDLYVLNGYGSLEREPKPQRNVLYRNDGEGRFTPLRRHPLSHAAFSGSAVWGDADNDGDPDVFIANQRGSDNLLYRNDEDGSFSPIREGAAVSDGGRSFSAAWVDIDGDGRLDLHVFNGRDGDEGEVDFLYRNEGEGRLVRVEGPAFTTGALPSGGGTWADFDGDGDPDLSLPVYADGEPHRLYRNDGDWAFTEIGRAAGLSPAPLPYWPASSVASWVDADNDLDLDLFVGNTRGTIDFLYDNDGYGRFAPRTAGRIGLDVTYVSDALWADLDNDADVDLVIGVWGGASEVWTNDGTGRLSRAAAGELGAEVGFVSSVSTADVDGDGRLDVYLTQWPINDRGGSPNLLYVNRTRAGNWLRVKLEGTDSNRSGIGARIRVDVTIAGRKVSQLRHVSSRDGWRSSSSLDRHFGLGDATRVDRIEVRWPSGRVDEIEGSLPINRRVTIREGVGIRAGT